MTWQNPMMTGTEFKRAYKLLNVSQAGIGRYLGISERTARRYVTGDLKVDRAHALLLRSMIHHGDAPEIPEWIGIRKRRLMSARAAARKAKREAKNLDPVP